MSDQDNINRARNSERIEDLVDRRIKKHTQRIEKKLFQLAEQLQKYGDKSRKRDTKKTKIDWKREGNRIQHEFLMDTLEMLSDIEKDIDSGVDRDACIEKVQKLKRNVKHRGKLIRMADQEEGGWETVKAYERSSLTDDDEDDRRTKNAVATAKRKLREKSESAVKKRRGEWGRTTTVTTARGTGLPSTPIQPMHHLPLTSFAPPVKPKLAKQPMPFRRGGTCARELIYS